MDDLLEEFIAETREMLETLSAQLVDWERHPEDSSLIDSVFRFVHTVKGSCGFLDLPRLARLSHAAEDLLSSARDGNLTASSGLVTAVLAVVDRIADLTDALENGGSVHDDDSELISEMLRFLPENANAGQAEDAALATVVGSEPAPATDSAEAEPRKEVGVRGKSRTVRVSLQLLDKLMTGVSDLVLSRNEVSRRLRGSSGSTGEVDQAFARLSSIVADMRDSINQMRMQNIDRLFSTLPRLLRDTMIELDKNIELRIEGSEVEVDREMVEVLRDPLTHILRNAADHGIESAEERVAAGKHPVGQISILARQSGSQIMIEISDDGRGIDVVKLGEKAIAAKIVTVEQWQKKPNSAQLAMIFEPGLSTAKEITVISGRGVGLDVVRSNLRSIGGTIDLENSEGRGLKMTLRLPLTLSIIAGLSVQASGQLFGVSRNSVEEILSVSNTNVEIEKVGGGEIAVIRGKRLPYARLEELLDLEIRDSETARSLIVIRPAVGARFALEVERVIDHEEIVVKPGAPLVMQSGLYSGTSLPDNGCPMLLLDASGLANAMGYGQVENDDIAGQEDSPQDQEAERKGAAALLFTTIEGRKQAVRLSVIDRTEDVVADQIKFIGGRMRVSVGDDVTDLFGLDHIPESGNVQLLRLSDGNQQKCLAVDEVIDMFTLDGEMLPSATPDVHEGVVSAFGESIELISIFPYFEETGAGAANKQLRPLCYVPCGIENGWERNILAPLLAASGYSVSHDERDEADASVIICTQTNADTASDEPRLLRLRDANHAGRGETGSIYRYDRAGLIAAIEQKLAGAG
ncbi:MAG: chemotaxis protein CheA [Sphingorhabdus sp.]